MKYASFVAASLLACSISATAHAQSAAATPAASATPRASASMMRVLTLRDGSTYSGELVESIPNDHITILLATGETRRIAWTDLASEPATPSTTATSTRPLAPVAADAGERRVQVRIDADDPRVSLLRIAGYGAVTGFIATPQGGMPVQMEAEALVPACGVPCGASLDPQWTYRIGGQGITPSRAFQLPNDEASVSLRVRAGSSPARTAGKTLTIVGAPVLAVGAIIFGIGLSFKTARMDTPAGAGKSSTPISSASTSDSSGRDSIITFGAVMGGVGLAALVTGIVLWATSGTSVEIEHAPKVALRPIAGGFAF